MLKKTVDQEPPVKTEVVAPDAPTCRHHWIIEPARSATSRGRCRFCSAEREFRNSNREYMWEDDSSSGYGSHSGASAVAKSAEDDEMIAAPRSFGAESAFTV